ncbi:MAG: hypothetical protein R3B99_06595 [Polyangiales bacterium]
MVGVGLVRGAVGELIEEERLRPDEAVPDVEDVIDARLEDGLGAAQSRYVVGPEERSLLHPLPVRHRDGALEGGGGRHSVSGVFNLDSHDLMRDLVQSSWFGATSLVKEV